MLASNLSRQLKLFSLPPKVMWAKPCYFEVGCLPPQKGCPYAVCRLHSGLEKGPYFPTSPKAIVQVYLGASAPSLDSRDVSLPVSDNLLTNYCLNALGWKYSSPRYPLSKHRPLFLSQAENRRFTERPERTRLAEPSGERPVHVLWETKVPGERTTENLSSAVYREQRQGLKGFVSLRVSGG